MTKRPLLVLFALALSARLLLPAVGYAGLVSDSGTYVDAGRSLAAGLGFADAEGRPTAFRPPTYPFFVAFCLLLSGGRLAAVQVAQALLASLLPPLVFELVERRAGRRRAWLAGLLLALDPVSVPFSALILTEALGSVLLAAWYLGWLSVLRANRLRDYAGSGLVAGILVYQTMITQLLQPIALVLRWLTGRGVWRGVALGVCLFVLPMAAWTIRNRVVLGETTAVRSGGFGFLLWATMNYDFPHLLNPYDPRGEHIFTQETRVARHYTPAEAHRVYTRKALARFRAEPLTCAWRVAKASFWSWTDVPGAMKSLDEMSWVKTLLRALNAALLLGALAGVPTAARTREGRLAIGILLYFAVFHAALYPIPRYFVPIRPFLALLCGFAFLARGAVKTEPAA